MQDWVVFCMLFLYSSYIRPICVLYKSYINPLEWVVFMGLGGGKFLCLAEGGLRLAEGSFML